MSLPISGSKMVRVHDYVERYAVAFMITKIRAFKREPFSFAVGGGDVTYRTVPLNTN